MEALPIITPSDVRIARSLFARSASIATDTVSRMSIIALRPEFSRGYFRQPLLKLSALLESLECFLRHFILWIQFQRALKFLRCVFPPALVFEHAPEPRVCRRRAPRALPCPQPPAAALAGCVSRCNPRCRRSAPLILDCFPAPSQIPRLSRRNLSSAAGNFPPRNALRRRPSPPIA